MAYTYNSVRNKFIKILTDHGQDAYLRKRCMSCAQGGHRAKYDKGCPECGGTGFVQKLEKHTMRKMIVGTTWSYTSALGLAGMGMLMTEGCYFFTLPNAKPRPGDIIYDWNNSIDDWERYTVQKVLERRWDNRVVFLTIACEITEGTDT